MKKQLLIILTLFSLSSYSNPNFVISSGLHMDKNGNLIQPDKIFLGYAFEAYQKGYHQTAIMHFKKAASLGNTIGQKYVGLMYIKSLGVNQDWAKGYAWLKLAAKDGSKDNIKLSEAILTKLKPQEISRAEKEYKLINSEYGTIAALTRRDRWVAKQKMKMTGTRTGALAFAPINFDTPHGNGLYNQMKSFVDDFNFGYVTGGEIITKDDSK